MAATAWKFCPFDGTPLPASGQCLHCGEQVYTAARHLVASSAGPQRPSLSQPSSSSSGRRQWRKVLYEQQDFDDNYTHESFLAQLQTNVNVTVYQYLPLVKGSAAVTQQLCLAVCLAIVFYYSVHSPHSFDVSFIFAMDVVFAILGYALGILLFYEATPAQRALMFQHKESLTATATSQDLKNTYAEPLDLGDAIVLMVFKHSRAFFVFAVLIVALSPVLRTLTGSYSNDTIWALSIFFMLLHLYLHDYGYINQNKRLKMSSSGHISLNAALFASVLLASRMPSSMHVFAFITLSMELFALFPILRRQVRIYSLDVHLQLTFIMFTIACAMLMPINKFLAALFVTTVLFLTFVAPFWLIWMQRFKDKINGPWDEAKLSKRSSGALGG